jgi:hypothetical protein
MFITEEKVKDLKVRVIEVIERHKTDFVGFIDKNFFFVSTANQNVYGYFYSKR